MSENHAADMATIHALLAQNGKIQRTVKKLPDGVETRTTSTDPAVARMIQEHTQAMKKRLHDRQPIRNWDPLFAVVFQHADKIKMIVKNIAGGVRIVETSSDAYVVQVIQSHAEAVNGFVAKGMAGMHESHPAPTPGNGTAGKSQPPLAFKGNGDGITTCPITGEPVDKAISMEYKGRTVYFCCAGCKETFLKSPETYLKSSETEPSGPDYTRTTDAAFLDVLKRVEEAAKAQGFKVPSTHDMAASLKAAGIEREPYTVVEVCDPRLAAAVLEAEPRFGSLMPCRIAVYRQNGKTVVSTLLPSRLIGLLPGTDGVANAARQVDDAMKSIIQDATR